MRAVAPHLTACLLLLAGCHSAQNGEDDAARPVDRGIASGRGTGRTTDYSVDHLPGLLLGHLRQETFQDVDGGNRIRKTFSVSFDNETGREIDSVNVRLRVMDRNTGALVYKSDPLTVDRFINDRFPSSGTFLPGNWTPSQQVAFTYPSEDWRTDTIDYVEVVSMKAFTGAQDLHQWSHLYTMIAKAKPGQAIAEFKAHPDLLNVVANNGATQLMMAAVAGDLATFRYLKSCGLSLANKTNDGETLVHLAARNQDVRVLEYVVGQGFKVTDLDEAGEAPLDKAIRGGTLADVQFLLQHGANPNQRTDATFPPGYWAIYTNRRDVLAALVRAGANPHFHDQLGHGWMHYAVALETMEDAVAKYGVPVDDAVKPHLETPLMYAVVNSCSNGWAWLLMHGADPSRKNANGQDSYELSKQGNTLNTDRFFRDDVAKFYRMPSVKRS